MVRLGRPQCGAYDLSKIQGIQYLSENCCICKSANATTETTTPKKKRVKHITDQPTVVTTHFALTQSMRPYPKATFRFKFLLPALMRRSNPLQQSERFVGLTMTCRYQQPSSLGFSVGWLATSSYEHRMVTLPGEHSGW